MMNQPTLDTLTQRLDRLERQNRWLKGASLLVLVGIAATLLMGQGSSPIVEADKFLVREPVSGKIRAALSLLPDGSVGLTLYDKTGKLRAELTAGVDGAPALALRDQDGKVIWKAP